MTQCVKEIACFYALAGTITLVVAWLVPPSPLVWGLRVGVLAGTGVSLAVAAAGFVWSILHPRKSG